ncbi:helix-turn-helix domain-containing protein, partial [Stenotrophomonas sp. YIM B06876]|uniref:helix-turn-helix domain-containing protein n=1 Tax=Stenotrophomonas sp. YIM B06876 TaxID=3060211 RepID=UPI002739D53D
MSEQPSSLRSGTQSIERGWMQVRLIANQGQRGMRICDLTLASGLSATTVFRIVQGLMREGVIERDGRTHKLYLGRL